MSRVAITLDEHALAELGRRAQANGEPVARTAARLVRDGLLSTQAQAGGEPAPATATRPAEGQDAGLPGWLEPPDKREVWRRELWAAVCALAERYPGVFSKLVADWWTDRALIEVLGALSAWRSQLDAGQSRRPARRAAVPRPPRAARAPAHPRERPDRRTLHRRATAVRVGRQVAQ